MPVLIAGGGCAGLSLGRFLNLGDIAYQHILYTLTQLFGHRDVTQFGEDGTDFIDTLVG